MKFRGFRRSTVAPALGRLPCVRHGDPGDGQLARVPGHDRSLARPDDLRLALVVDPADRLVGGRPFDPAGDVFRPAAGVTGTDQNLLALADALKRPGRQDLQLLDARVAIAGRCRALADPLAQDAILERAGSEPHAPFVRDRAGGLRQEQAPPRVGELHAAASVLLHDVEEIGRRIIAPQREPETAFAGQRAMARTRVAPLLSPGAARRDCGNSRRTACSCLPPRRWPWQSVHPLSP